MPPKKRKMHDYAYSHAPSDTYDIEILPSDSMHWRNIYHNNPPDFLSLIPDHIISITGEGKDKKGHVDWNNPETTLALTKALLLNDFKIKFDMPIHHLCPPVPQRLNYLHWIADLLHIYPGKKYPSIKGLDIGTGSSCIFPLLGNKIYGWKFDSSEIDLESVTSAQKNIDINQLNDDIQVHHVTDSNVIFEEVLKICRPEDYAFTMCNPPFFSSTEETHLNRKRTCNATENELVCQGGEVEFVFRMILESYKSKLKERVEWFTTMVGLSSSLHQILNKFKKMKTAIVTHTTFEQGNQKRYGIAWTFNKARGLHQHRIEVLMREKQYGNQHKCKLRFTLCKEDKKTAEEVISKIVHQYSNGELECECEISADKNEKEHILKGIMYINNDNNVNESKIKLFKYSIHIPIPTSNMTDTIYYTVYNHDSDNEQAKWCFYQFVIYIRERIQ